MPGQSALLYDKINLARGASSIESNKKQVFCLALKYCKTTNSSTPWLVEAPLDRKTGF